MKQLLLSILTMSIISSCHKVAANNPAAVPAAQVIRNIAYGDDPAQQMDVYLPAGRSGSSTPVLVLIHGGAWVSGDKADFVPYVDSFHRRFPHYAIFNINYRLATFARTNLYPTQENDVQAAVKFIYDKRREYQVSDQFILLGASAGANLALLQGYKQTDPVKVKAVIDFFGPADMTALYRDGSAQMRAAMQIFMGGTPDNSPTNYKNASPISFVTPQTPPTLILYGGADALVPPAQNSLLESKLEQAGVPHKTVYYPAQGHGWYGDKLADSFDKVADFLKDRE